MAGSKGARARPSRPAAAAQPIPDAAPSNAALTKLLPQLPGRPLRAVELVPSLPLAVVGVPQLLLPPECASVTQRGDLFPWESVSHPATSMYASRDNDRVEWRDPELSQRVWHGTGLDLMIQQHITPALIPVAGRVLRAVGLNTKWRLYRYRKGQHFGPHFDESVECPDYPSAQSLYTLLVYLNEDCEGGETVFYQGKRKVLLSVKPATGMGLLHTQGAQCLRHEGAEVTEGEKWLLRSDVMFGP